MVKKVTVLFFRLYELKFRQPGFRDVPGKAIDANNLSAIVACDKYLTFDKFSNAAFWYEPVGIFGAV